MNSTENSEVEWGPEIPVNGVRPAWLRQTDMVQLKTQMGWRAVHDGWTDPKMSPPLENWAWSHSNGGACIVAIRLPANHPHYAAGRATNAPTPPVQGQSGVRTGVECLERMEALVRRMADYYNTGSSDDEAIAHEALSWMREAHSLRALLLEPVDGDLVEARLIADGYLDAPSKDIEDGGWDSSDVVQAALEAIKRGRALQMGEGL